MKAKRATPRRREAPRFDDRAAWDQASMLLWARSRGLCERCGETPPAERHHRKRRRDGGDRLSNLLFLCSPCHRFITDRPESDTLARERGHVVSALGSSDPVSVPVLLWGSSWSLLDDAGHAVRCDPPA